MNRNNATSAQVIAAGIHPDVFCGGASRIRDVLGLFEDVGGCCKDEYSCTGPESLRGPLARFQPGDPFMAKRRQLFQVRVRWLGLILSSLLTLTRLAFQVGNRRICGNDSHAIKDSPTKPEPRQNPVVVSLKKLIH